MPGPLRVQSSRSILERVALQIRVCACDDDNLSSPGRIRCLWSDAAYANHPWASGSHTMSAVVTSLCSMLEERFDADGFAVIPQVLSAQECDDIAALTGGLAEDAAGTRCLLPQA